MTDLNSQNIRRFKEMTDKASSIAIITHMKPDGDAIGSATGLLGFLHRYKTADTCLVLNDSYPEFLSFLFNEEDKVFIHSNTPLEAEKHILDADLLICTDFNATHRTGNLEQALLQSKAPKILIDHHLGPDRDKFDLVFSETQISSASELVYTILLAQEECSGSPSAIPIRAAESLMTGMTTDTNNFSNSTFPSTLKMASELIAAGVDRNRILNRLFNQFGEKRLRLLGHMLKDLLTITEDGVAYMVLDKETMLKYEMNEGDTEGFVNYPLSIKDVKMSLLLKEEDDKARVSIRSKIGTSANKCAKLYFNGGGHENASGGKLLIPENISSIKEAGKYIETATHKFFNE